MRSVEQLEAEVRRLAAECESLRNENAFLRQRLEARHVTHSTPAQPISTALPAMPVPSASPVHPADSVASVTSSSPAAERIALFRSLFRGRDDVYARRWDGRDGRSGYSPACANEWNPRLCHKPCSGCKNYSYKPVSDHAVTHHLSAKPTMGVYPLLLDETCWFSAVDFDGESWQDDSLAFLSVSDAMGCPRTSSVLVQVGAATYGYSSIPRYRQLLRAILALPFSLAPWTPDVR